MMNGSANISQRDAMAAAMKNEGTPLAGIKESSHFAARSKKRLGTRLIPPAKTYGMGVKKVMNKNYFPRKTK